jgi:hypothetical protein
VGARAGALGGAAELTGSEPLTGAVCGPKEDGGN